MTQLQKLRWARFRYQSCRRCGMSRIASAVDAYQWLYSPAEF